MHEGPDAPTSRWSGARRRRTVTAIEGAREAAAIAATLGRDIRAARRSRGLTQQAVGDRIGLTHSRVGDLERGHGAGAPLGVWIAAAIAVGRPLAIAASRPTDPEPRDAGHLAVQELILRYARENGANGTFELPARPATPALSIDVGLRDDRHRTLVLVEVWNRLDDLGAAVRTLHRKIAEAEGLAVIAGGDLESYRVAACWVMRATAANRQLVRRYPAILASEFRGSSRRWIQALANGAAAPLERGLIWADGNATRLFEARIGA